MKNFLLLLTLFVFSGLLAYMEVVVGESQSTVFSSAYTDFSDKFCKDFDSENPGSDGWMECSGIGGYGIHIFYNTYGHEIASVRSSDNGFQLSLTKNSECGQSQYYGGKLEWRLANRRPFAGIIRVVCLDFEDEEGSFEELGQYLLVVGLEGHENIDFSVDVRENLNANVQARELADRNYSQDR